MKKTKDMCIGCRDNYYNQTQKDGCWNFASATIINKIEVGLNERPPYNKNRQRPVLSCFGRQGYVQINPKNTDYEIIK